MKVRVLLVLDSVRGGIGWEVLMNTIHLKWPVLE